MMRNYCNYVLATLGAGIFCWSISAQDYPSPSELALKKEAQIRLYETAARELPSGVPNPLDPDGTYSDGIRFTTKAYQRAAFSLVLEEANRVAQALALPETLPITESNVVRAFISPFGDAYVNKCLGSITTRNYKYGVQQGNRFSDLCIAHYDEHCFEYQKKYRLPIGQVDTNAAHHLATQWLVALGVDINALARDCQMEVTPAEFWNTTKRGAKLEGKTFVPIYDIHWTSPKAKSFGQVVHLELFAPTKTILQFSIYEPKYMLRQPLHVTNLAFLLGQTNAPVTTNAPARQ